MYDSPAGQTILLENICRKDAETGYLALHMIGNLISDPQNADKINPEFKDELQKVIWKAYNLLLQEEPIDTETDIAKSFQGLITECKEYWKTQPETDAESRE